MNSKKFEDGNCVSAWVYLVSIEVCTNRDTLTYREVTVSIAVHRLINKYCILVNKL